MNIRTAILLFVSLLLANPAKAEIIYTNWISNDGETANYILTVDHDLVTNEFNWNLTVDPWNAEALGLFIDFGDATVVDTTISNSDPLDSIVLYATDTALNDCGMGCNLEGLAPPLADPDGEWEMVFRLGEAGLEGIQTFSWTTSDQGLSLASFGLVGVRSQALCPDGVTIDNDPNGLCTGSDKSYSATPRDPRIIEIPEPSPVFFLGLGLIGAGLARRKQLS